MCIWYNLEPSEDAHPFAFCQITSPAHLLNHLTRQANIFNFRERCEINQQTHQNALENSVICFNTIVRHPARVDGEEPLLDQGDWDCESCKGVIDAGNWRGKTYQQILEQCPEFNRPDPIREAVAEARAAEVFPDLEMGAESDVDMADFDELDRSDEQASAPPSETAGSSSHHETPPQRSPSRPMSSRSTHRSSERPSHQAQDSLRMSQSRKRQRSPSIVFDGNGENQEQDQIRAARVKRFEPSKSPKKRKLNTAAKSPAMGSSFDRRSSTTSRTNLTHNNDTSSKLLQINIHSAKLTACRPITIGSQSSPKSTIRESSPVIKKEPMSLSLPVVEQPFDQSQAPPPVGVTKTAPLPLEVLNGPKVQPSESYKNKGKGKVHAVPATPRNSPAEPAGPKHTSSKTPADLVHQAHQQLQTALNDGEASTDALCTITNGTDDPGADEILQASIDGSFASAIATAAASHALEVPQAEANILDWMQGKPAEYDLNAEWDDNDIAADQAPAVEDQADLRVPPNVPQHAAPSSEPLPNTPQTPSTPTSAAKRISQATTIASSSSGHLDPNKKPSTNTTTSPTTISQLKATIHRLRQTLAAQSDKIASLAETNQATTASDAEGRRDLAEAQRRIAELEGENWGLREQLGEREREK